VSKPRKRDLGVRSRAVPLSSRERHVLRIALFGLKELSVGHAVTYSANELDRLLDKIGRER
jgi:hypothetical protein